MEAKGDIKLKIVGHEPAAKPDKEGFLPIPFFSKSKGKYKISFNEKNSACLWKFTKGDASCVPHICLTGKDGEPADAVEHLEKGGTIIVDQDILAKA